MSHMKIYASDKDISEGRGSLINLLDFLNTIAAHGNCVKRIEDIVLPSLHGEVSLFENEPQ